MFEVFNATLQPLLTLFLCIAIGFVLAKKQIIPHSAAKSLANLETWVFIPALSFTTMVRNFTIDALSYNLQFFLFGCIGVGIALIISYSTCKFFVRETSYEQNIYKYALTIGNVGYMGDPLVQTMFGDAVLSYYKMFYLPLSFMIYTWGIKILTPATKEKQNPFKALLNAPTISLFLGVFAGLFGFGDVLSTHVPFLMNTLDSLKACMGPAAMLIAGITIAKYDFVSMLKNKKVYLATFMRLIAIPIVMIACLYGIRLAAINLFQISISNSMMYLAFFAYAAPLGLNTVVFPEAYGGDPKTGASMATISHTLCVITIPLLFSLMYLIFGAPVW